MSPPEKRRGNSHSIRSSTSSRNSIISPPPRAQLTRAASTSSSPGPDNESNQDVTSSGTKDNISSLAAKEKESILLKEKDDKIAELKRELTVMEAEFTRELDRLSQKEGETASFWQAKLVRTETELQLLRAEVDVREAERAELREGWDRLRKEIKERDDEIRSLKGHISGLKQWVSTNTARGHQTSDEEFGDSMAKLGNGLQNWVIVHFRRAKLDFTHADEAAIRDLAELVPMYEQVAVSAKVHLLQNVVSSILVETVFESYFVGLPEDQTRQLTQIENYLRSISSIEAVNQWRATTLTILRKEATPRMQEEMTLVIESVVSRINHILDTITDASATEARDNALRALVHNSVELARLLVVQKATFKVYMPKIYPHQRTLFEASTMEDIGAEDEDNLAGREICCVTFPGIIKTGDENGDHPHFKNVVAKARVLCNPE
ncbi:uncharacterized protein F4812DRAFT_169371 [Daldinia caldariorum]|uniref:uncharacterized protein n=1 Tax=Daldinia caldariorum TaxID=326644 RepID=UPI002008509C|nr:uncharacterized protein F4812DRAFT_169371 [Daldinia caldariorum]KAI1471183.1 hypothetical protein F4812DRAFT_169371 [Daldinia caldariorum]